MSLIEQYHAARRWERKAEDLLRTLDDETDLDLLKGLYRSISETYGNLASSIEQGKYDTNDRKPVAEKRKDEMKLMTDFYGRSAIFKDKLLLIEVLGKFPRKDPKDTDRGELPGQLEIISTN